VLSGTYTSLNKRADLRVFNYLKYVREEHRKTPETHNFGEKERKRKDIQK
jgi:hypothetical protein